MPQPSAQQIADQAINRMEAEEAGIVPAPDADKPKDDADKGGSDDKPKDTDKDAPKDDAAGKPKSGDGDKSDDDKGDDKKPDEDEPEFTADDALEIEDKPADDKPDAPTDNAGIQLSPAEQKYIAENIGEPIVIRGVRGEGDAAKEVEIKAYSPADIPADFRFANDQQLAAATTGFQQLETKANQLLGNFRQNQSTQAASDFERRENEGIRADVADLQKEGRFPKFKIQPGQAGFDDDPAAQQMTEVLKVMTSTNEKYLAQYNQGRPYKHIGFAEAFDIWERNNASSAASKKAEEDQKKEDDERKARGSEEGASNRGTSASNIVKPTVKSGTSTRDIMARIDAMD